MTRYLFATALLTTSVLWAASPADYDKNWPQWRGPDMSGTAHHSNPPLKWDDNTNIKWKTEVPGRGLATPIIWGNRIYLLTAIKTERKGADPKKPGPRQAWMKPVLPEYYQSFQVLAYDRDTGKQVWSQEAIVDMPHEGFHGDASWASGSAVTDGKVLIASFGSRGIFAYSMNGKKKLWKRDLGDMRTRNGFGEGSTPAIHGNYVVVQWDHEDQSFIEVLDRKTGKTIWKKDRDEPTSWSTPIIRTVDGREQVITNATNQVCGYDLATGEKIWHVGGMTLNTIPSPVEKDGVIYVASGFRGNALMAVKLSGAKGDLTGTEHVLWQHNRDTPYVPSLLLYQDKLYFIKSNSAIISCFDTATGKPHYGPQRLEGIRGIYASPVGAAGRVYVTGRDGTTLVLDAGPEYKVLATNKLDDHFDASAAIVGDRIYLRGHRYLYCIAE
ncbi:MAG: PQQ-binding-like beta-propeller repeat protein [Acidobacteriota bacterium]|nr:PQQ-binding-like beta-propeller repeat protein [Acidobacteriota bacterium]